MPRMLSTVMVMSTVMVIIVGMVITKKIPAQQIYLKNYGLRSSHIQARVGTTEKRLIPEWLETATLFCTPLRPDAF